MFGDFGGRGAVSGEFWFFGGWGRISIADWAYGFLGGGFLRKRDDSNDVSEVHCFN